MKPTNLLARKGAFRLGLVAAVAASIAINSSQAQTVTKDKVAGYAATFSGATVFTLPGAGHTGQATDHAMNLPVLGSGSGLVNDAAFLAALNAATAMDEMTVVLWVKKYDIAAGSAFWFASPSSNNGERGFQAHLPWSDNNIYYDTAGCCTAEDPFADPLVGQRINALITTYDPYNAVGDDTWWTDNWHLFVFTKKGPVKKIYIDDANLFLEGVGGATKLPTDFRALYIGSDNTATAGLYHSLVDDFAVFSKELTEDNIKALFSGTLPTALPANTGLFAYWDFNDFPGEGVFVSISPAENSTGAAPNLIKIVHIDGVTPWAEGNISLKVDGVAVTPTFVKNGLEATVTYVPSPWFTGQTTHKASFTYPGAWGAPVTRDWGFIVGPYTKDVVASHVGTFLDGSAFTAGGGGRSGQAGDLGADFGAGTGPVRVHDASFLNGLAQNDEMCFAFWMRKPGIEAGSAFWANSPSSAADQRGFQAHVPWSDSNIYFDTAGCCGPTTERINYLISNFPAYTDVTWWNSWHSFVFQKKLSTKEIYIDGEFFWGGDNTDPLPTDFTELYIGATASGVNLTSGVFDDFAIFGTALSQDSITALFTGSLPTALPASDKLTAYWNFNDFPAAGMFTSIVPAPNTTNARPELVYVVHLDGSVVWDQSKVSLRVDDAPVAFTFAKNGTQSEVSYVPNPWFAVGSTHKATLTYPGEGTAQETLEWQFTIGTFGAVSEDLWTAPGTGDSTKPGLKARVWQVDQPGSNSLVNRTHRAEQELAGIIGPNVADLTGATDGVFAIDKLNWNQDVPTGIGSFPSDETPIPGIPGTGSNANDSIAAEVITYIEFPTAGYYSMGVHSDDGFKVTVADTPPANNLALVVTGAASAAGSYHALSGPAETSKPFTAPVSAKLVYMDPFDGCTELLNAGALVGNIALVDRGTCEFTFKMKAAKDAGAMAVVLVNNRELGNAEGIYPITMGAGAAGYQDIPAVMISMPDGDRIKTGLDSELTASLAPDDTPALGENDGDSLGAGRVFSFIVPAAGVYPFRCVWFEGNGGANVEWFSVTPSGQKVLINDLTNPAALKGFRARTAMPQPKVTLSVARQGGNLTITSDPQPLPAGFVLQTASSVNGPWTTQAGANTPITVPIGNEAAVFLRAAKP